MNEWIPVRQTEGFRLETKGFPWWLSDSCDLHTCIQRTGNPSPWTSWSTPLGSAEEKNPWKKSHHEWMNELLYAKRKVSDWKQKGIPLVIIGFMWPTYSEHWKPCPWKSWSTLRGSAEKKNPWKKKKIHTYHVLTRMFNGFTFFENAFVIKPLSGMRFFSLLSDFRLFKSLPGNKKCCTFLQIK